MFENFIDAYKITSNPLGFCVKVNMKTMKKINWKESHSIQSVHLIRNTFENENFH